MKRQKPSDYHPYEKNNFKGTPEIQKTHKEIYEVKARIDLRTCDECGERMLVNEIPEGLELVCGCSFGRTKELNRDLLTKFRI